MNNGDKLHVIIKDLVGTMPTIELYDEDGVAEDGYYGNDPVIETYDVLFNTTDNPTKVYLYQVASKNSILLDVPEITNASADIAHTQNKLWLYKAGGSTTIQEWDITLNPFTAIYNREITNIKSSSGLGAINDTTLISFEYVDALNLKVYDTDIINAVAVNTFKYNATAGRVVTGDYILTTTDKLIVLNYSIDSPFPQYITQYDYITGVLEFDIDISSVFTGFMQAYGLFEFDNEIYITGRTIVDLVVVGVIYKIDKTAPYALTLFDTTVYGINGASQVPEQLTVHFT